MVLNVFAETFCQKSLFPVILNKYVSMSGPVHEYAVCYLLKTDEKILP